jgi:hypothetical protein
VSDKKPWLAHMNWSRWIAECPRGCGSAEELRPPDQTVARCEECGYSAPVTWPANSAAITAVLLERPMPRTRNWYPKDHPTAVANGLPHGQSVADLRAEAAEHGTGGQ